MKNNNRSDGGLRDIRAHPRDAGAGDGDGLKESESVNQLSPELSSLVNDKEDNFQSLFCFTYTSVTSKGLVTSLPPTSATRVILFKRMAVLSIIFTDTSWISAFLYQIPPLSMILSSRSFPQDPPIWTNTAFSWKRLSRASTFLSAIHCHFSSERLMIS